MLNSDDRHYRTGRIGRLRKAILALKELRDAASRTGLALCDEKVLDAEFQKKIARLQKVVSEGIGGVMKVSLSLSRVEPSGQCVFGHYTEPAKEKKNSLEPFVAIALLNDFVRLATKGKIDHIRQCAFCSRWFFAKMSHHAHCPPEKGKTSCQIKHHRSSEEWRQKRNQKNREYYALRMKHNVLTLEDRKQGRAIKSM
jgi:hypothetical protein